jgi:hypothetical protein
MVRHIYFATKVQIKSQNAKNIDDYLLNLPVAIKKTNTPTDRDEPSAGACIKIKYLLLLELVTDGQRAAVAAKLEVAV